MSKYDEILSMKILYLTNNDDHPYLSGAECGILKTNNFYKVKVCVLIILIP